MNRLSHVLRRKRKGLVALVTVMALPVLLVLTGMVIDVGRAYMIKAKLYSAVDAAAIAAARAIADGETAARDAAEKYFTANLPPGYMSSSSSFNKDEDISFATDPAGNVSIDIGATAEMPITFLSAMDEISTGPWYVGASAQAIRRAVDLVLVVDNTTSLKLGSLGDVTADVKARSIDFVNNFHESFDRLALVKFAYGAEVPVGFSSSRGFNVSNVTSAINAFQFGSWWNAQYTNASEGFFLALDALRTVSDPANLQVIVFFTDGAPNTFASEFTLTDGNAYQGAIRSSDESSGRARGLYKHDEISDTVDESYANRGVSLDSYLEEFPEYYNLHGTHDPDDPLSDHFKIVNPWHANRPVPQFENGVHDEYDLHDMVNDVSRNLVEDMAEAARQEGIYVFTLGLGSSLTAGSGPNNEYGQDMLLRMANDPDLLKDANLAGDYKSDQLEGVYCHAVDENALEPCFAEMLEVIIRLTL